MEIVSASKIELVGHNHLFDILYLMSHFSDKIDIGYYDFKK